MLRRSAVYIALRETVGHNLVFRHYTNKVVVGKWAEEKRKKFEVEEKTKSKKQRPGG